MSLLNGKKLAVIGDPIGHSLSPVIQQAMLDALGLDCSYGCIRVPAGSVADWLPSAEGLGLGGFNATMPHKADLVPLMDDLSADARLFRAVNTVVLRKGRYLGFNTDGQGFLRSLHDEGIEPAGRRIVVLGAGGAARAVVLKLASAGAGHITLCCRTPAKAAELASSLPSATLTDFSQKSLDTALKDADLLINASPLGMIGMPEDFSDLSFLDVLPAQAPVCDLIYRPLKTSLLGSAEARGHHAVNGLGMLIHQAILALELFADMELDVTAMKAAVMKKLIPALEANP